MTNTPVLCVDFGSAYTKVAVRADWNESAQLIREVPLAPKGDSSFCIPSVVARVERSGGPRWLVGEAAAGQLPGEGVKIYRHWKASLLSEQPAAEEVIGPMQPSPSTPSEYLEVGAVFFKSLKDTLSKMGLSIDKCKTRVCIPRLAKGDRASERIKQVFSSAAWKFDGETLSEPQSNVIGVFTAGRNAAWQAGRLGRAAPHFPFYQRMFDSDGLFGAFRRGALEGQDVRYGVLVIDVGAYTTDFGYVVFDHSFYDGDVLRPEISQLSCEVGVRELDSSVQACLRPEVRHVVERMATSKWESTKRILYSKGEAAVQNPKGGMFVIGEGDEAETIDRAIKTFAGRVVGVKNEFCRDNVDEAVHAVVLTGGGTMIPIVQKALVTAIRKEQGTRFFDLSERPREVRRWTDGVWGWRDGDQEIESELRRNQELIRGGSALGGCSVYFDSTDEPVAAKRAGR
jgi:hypothetical protein